MEEFQYSVLKAFADSFHETISSMTGLNVNRLKAAQEIKVEGAPFQIMMSFCGVELSGFMVMRCSLPSLLRLYKNYLGEEVDAYNESVQDGMKELVGIIGGSAAGKEQQLKLKFSPLTVSLSEEMNNHLTANALGAAVDYYVDKCGVFTIEVQQQKPQ